MVLQPPPPGSDVTQIVLPFGWFRVALTVPSGFVSSWYVRRYPLEPLGRGMDKKSQNILADVDICTIYGHGGQSRGHFDWMETTLESLAFGYRQLVGIICEHSVKREAAHAKGVLLTKETL